MFKIRPLVVALTATTMLTTAGMAAEQTGKTSASENAKPSAAAQIANQDFGKLSADGAKAFRDVRLARVAIFDGQIDQAKKLIGEAQTAITKAKTDETAFIKDETSLTPPPGVSQKTSPTGKDTIAPAKTPIAWLPVGGGLSIGEDFATTPTKAAGVAKANDQLKKGDHKQAMETLKLSDISVTFVMEVAPLDKTVSEIDHAAQLIDSGKYYEGNQALKVIEDSVRFDVAEANSSPKRPAVSDKKIDNSSKSDAAGSNNPSANSATKAVPSNK